MILYNTILKYTSGKIRKDDKDTLNPTVDDRRFKEIILDVNDRLGVECGLDGNLSVQVVGGKTGCLEIDMVCNQDKVSLEKCEQWLKKHFSDNYAISRVSVTNSKEISVKNFIQAIQSADRKGFASRGYMFHDLDLDYYNNGEFCLQEFVCEAKPLSKKAAFEQATMMMADKSFTDELERIYSAENEKKFYGHPVHYKIAAANVEAAKDMLKLLVRSLKSNERLLGTRVNYLCNMEESCHHDTDLEHLIQSGKGATIAIEMSGSNEDHGVYASAYHQVIQYFEDQINVSAK